MGEIGVTCLVCGSNMDYPEGYHCKNCEKELNPFGYDKEVFVVGWECPICHRGLSPDVTICEHSGVDMDLVMEQIQDKAGIYGDKIVSDDAIKEQMFSGSPINFDLWKGLQWYEDEDEDED